MENLRVWQYQEDSTPTCRERTLKKKVNLMELSQDTQKIVLIAQILFLYHELSVCPLILNYIKISQRPRTDLNKRFLPRPKTITA